MTHSPELNWQSLQRLRRVFLESRPPVPDYWSSETDLHSYDLTFAQRIGWKWDYVMEELHLRGWDPPRGDVVDWGCGSGVAGRAYVDHVGQARARALWYWDRSPLARTYAIRRAREKYPSLEVHEGLPEHPTVLLISHVLGELAPDQVEDLLRLVLRATATLWVEPGTYEASLTLIAIRERLRHRLHAVAPCLHRERCGILAPGNEPHWCHHFAPSPPEVHTDPFWGRFGRDLNIDLTSLPLSFLVLDQRPAPQVPYGSVRIVGRPRIYKPEALILACDATGVRDYHLHRRHHPRPYQCFKKGSWSPIQIWRRQNDLITEIQPFHSGSPIQSVA
ncbi:MAG: class I SAM-dependent methyltransferase [Verrucomicrobiota bacterium]|nr:hypothetical protein [Limisphaera sp.]MDW8383044.1 class I SAM-dependent methyltransferase [Verrucomicrobiota bacterium]